MVAWMSLRKGESNYRWYVLTLAALTHTFAVAMPAMCMPVLFKEISEDLGLSLVQIGAIWGMGALPGMFTGVIGGSIGDRFGTNRTLSVTCLLAGVTGALRGLSGGFVALAATVFLSGLLSPVIPMNVHKTCSVWFSGRRLGLANGVVATGMAFGFMVGSMISATVLSPWLGGWRNVLFFYGAISIAVSVLWRLMRTAPGDVESSASDVSTMSLRQALSHLVRLRNVWLLGLAILGVGGCVQAMLGYLPLYLREIGWTGAGADGALAAFHGISMISAIPITMLSDRIGLRKVILIIASLTTSVGVGLLSVADGTTIWIAVILAGMVRDGFMALFITMITETEGVGPELTGTAMGLVMIASRIGNLIAPPLGNSLADVDLGLPFVFWAALATVAFFGFYFVKED